MKVKIDTKDLYAKLNKRTEGYAVAVRGILNKRIGEIVAMCEGLEIEEDKVFKFADYEDINPQVSKKLRELYSELYQSVRGNVAQEWKYANTWNDEFVKRMFGRKCIEDNRYAKYFAHNKDAMNAFFARKQDGLDLSQRIWKYIGQAKEELELALDLGLGEGLSADELSRAVREFLHEPKKLFRRVRNKHGNLVLSKAAKAYHPGKGVYRSSYRNAERLARTETNMAYRTADITRWQQMDFIIGYEVKLSKNHPVFDICDELAGKYPKTFVFKGWHPNCRCYIVPILCTEEELEQLTEMILRGESTQGFTPAGVVDDVPDEFKGWIANNTERIEAASSLPYFIKDNYKDGNIAKGFAWIEQDKNIAGLGNFSKLLVKQEIDVDKFTNMQTFTSTEFKECSNYVYGDKDYKLCNNVPNTGVQFETVGKLSDKNTLADLLQDATFGEDNVLKYFTDEQLAELNKVATMAKFTSKADAKFMFALDKDAVDFAIQGDTAQFVGSKYIRTNYGDTCKYAIKNGILLDEKGAMCVVNLPKGSRYLQTLANDEQIAMLLPNAKFKVLSTETKTIVQAGKATKVMQYNMELVDDGSDYVKSLTEVKTQVKSEIAAYNKAKKAANNVIGAAEKFGVDASDLKDLLDAYPTKDLLTETKSLAKVIVNAKQEIIGKYGGLIDNPVAIAKKYGIDTLDDLYNGVQSKLSSFNGLPLDKQKAKLEFEINWVKDKKKYETWQEAATAYTKVLNNVNKQIELQTVKSDIDSVISFSLTTKSAKVKNLAMELQQLINGTSVSIENVKIKLAEAQKEVTRLEKERAKRAAKNIGNTFNEDVYSQARKDAAMWAKKPSDADKRLRDKCGEVWRNATQEEREAAYYYTHTYCPINEPLRGLPYYGDSSKLKIAQSKVSHLTSIINKSSYDFDMWLQRGVDDGNNMLNMLLSGKNEQEVIKKIVGTVVQDNGFISCGNSKGMGFDHKQIIFNIYCPRGTKAMYLEPFSAFGNGSCSVNWDGLAKQTSFGNEAEVLLQRGTKFRITKVVNSSSKWYIDLEVVEQPI